MREIGTCKPWLMAQPNPVWDQPGNALAKFRVIWIHL